MRNILEFEKKHPSLLDIPSSDLIIDKKWKVFYESFLQYIGIDIKSKRLYEPWVPFGKLRESQNNKIDPIFAKNNILLPKGELQWV
jgi:hypothetical protein